MTLKIAIERSVPGDRFRRAAWEHGDLITISMSPRPVLVWAHTEERAPLVYIDDLVGCDWEIVKSETQV